MKRIFTLFAAAVAAVTMCARTAESGMCGADLTWFYNPSDNSLTIAGTGPMTNYSANNQAPWFGYNDKITKIILEPGMTTIGDYAFYGLTYVANEIDIPEGVTSIGDYAFDLCTSVRDIYIPYGVKTIGEAAFGVCTKLSYVELPYGVTSIGSYAFAWTGIDAVVIPATVSSIGDYAFQNCPNLRWIHNLATNPQTINANVFEYTDKSKITLMVPDYAYNNYSKPQWIEFERRSFPTNYDVENSNYQLAMNFETGVLTLTGTGVLPQGIEYDDDLGWYYISYAFFTSQITQLSLPAGMTGIGEESFAGLYSLTSVKIPYGVAILKEGAFWSCSALETVEIPGSTVIIEDKVFADCRSLKTVYNYATVPQTINWNVFDNVDISKCTLYVPKGSKAAYKAANVWKEFIIEEIAEPGKEGIENTPSPLWGESERGYKFLRNGMLLIERNGKTYTTSGTEVR